jgi:hypothetical protein
MAVSMNILRFVYEKTAAAQCVKETKGNRVPLIPRKMLIISFFIVCVTFLVEISTMLTRLA